MLSEARRTETWLNDAKLLPDIARRGIFHHVTALKRE